MRRIGVLTSVAADNTNGQARSAAFVRGLQQLGWTDSRNVRIGFRWSAGDIRKHAGELAALAPDLILANGSPDHQIPGLVPQRFPIQSAGKRIMIYMNCFN